MTSTRNAILSRSVEQGRVTLEEIKRASEVGALREQMARKELEVARCK